jgi:glycine/serine hydroxymethyltransferase
MKLVLTCQMKACLRFNNCNLAIGNKNQKTIIIVFQNGLTRKPYINMFEIKDQGICRNLNRKHEFLPFARGEIDLYKLKKEIQNNDEKSIKSIIYLDNSNSLESLDYSILEELSDNTLKIVDISHDFNFIYSGYKQSPLRYCDILLGNTHKSFPGPHRGVILIGKNNDLIDKLNSKAYLMASSCHLGSLLALSITLQEMNRFGKEYCLSIEKYRNELANLLEKLGMHVMKNSKGEYSENHHIHILLSTHSNQQLNQLLFKSGIKANIMRDSDKTYLRLGTQNLARLNFPFKKLEELALLIYQVVKNKSIISNRLIQFENNIYYSFDQI